MKNKIMLVVVIFLIGTALFAGEESSRLKLSATVAEGPSIV